MSHKEVWNDYKAFAKESRGNHGSEAILAADRIVRAAVALSKAWEFTEGGRLKVSLSTLRKLNRAVENFEREVLK